LDIALIVSGTPTPTVSWEKNGRNNWNIVESGVKNQNPNPKIKIKHIF
jgi:hypothetical protein